MSVVINQIKNLSYSKQSGLRSMQHVKDELERWVIKTYKNELTHDIWGNSEKLKDWANEKVDFIAYGDYPSKLLDPDLLCEGRYYGIKNWYALVKSNCLTKDNPYIQLRIMKFVTDNLKPDNKALTPIINLKVFEDAVFNVNKYGCSFKKIYNKMMKTFDTGLNVKTEEIAVDGVRGKWFSLRVPDSAEAYNNPAKFNKIKEFISILSQGSNWCTRTPKTVGNDFSGSTFDIFIDDKGIPQLCLTRPQKNTNWFRFIKGNNQYKSIPDKFKKVLMSFLKKNDLEDAVVGTNTNYKPVKSMLL